LDILIETIKNSISRLKIDVKIMGILPTIFTKNQSIDSQVLDYIRNEYDYKLLVSIRKNVKLSETGISKQSIFDYAPSSSGSEDYSLLVKEILNG